MRQASRQFDPKKDSVNDEQDEEISDDDQYDEEEIAMEFQDFVDSYCPEYNMAEF